MSNTERLEEPLTVSSAEVANSDDDNVDISKDDKEGNRLRMMILTCAACNKEFDNSQVNADVELSLCSMCNAATIKSKYPEYGTTKAIFDFEDSRKEIVDFSKYFIFFR